MQHKIPEQGAGRGHFHYLFNMLYTYVYVSQRKELSSNSPFLTLGMVQ